jgi:hypothetical protein
MVEMADPQRRQIEFARLINPQELNIQAIHVLIDRVVEALQIRNILEIQPNGHMVMSIYDWSNRYRALLGNAPLILVISECFYIMRQYNLFHYEVICEYPHHHHI